MFEEWCDENYMSEEDFDFAMDESLDAWVDSLLESVGVTREEFIKASEQPMMLNPNRFREFALVYKMLRDAFKGTDTIVTYKINEPFKSMGSISVIGENIIYTNPKVFLTAVKHASNFDSYPKIDGTVQITFTFHGMANTIKSGKED